MREWGCQRAPPGAPEHERRASAGSSSSYGQWRESYVPWREAETFALLPERPGAPSGSLVRSTRWSPQARRAALTEADLGGASAAQVTRGQTSPHHPPLNWQLACLPLT